MQKELSEMSLEELWQLFPIQLSEPQPHWINWYEEEAHYLKKLLSLSEEVGISHIGSTAISGIWAKPIIDLLIEVADDVALVQVEKTLIASGYQCMSKMPGRISFNKGYTSEGFAEKVFHLHLRRLGDHDERYFCAYLNQHPEIASAYEQLKLILWKKYPNDRDAYTEAKSEFVTKYTLMAKEEGILIR
ncbi:MAG: GrpB family protein [Turicibacter sp.]|nr:GrpB family protein [Turicibacter sp.]